jgi:hypothetical protein
MSYRNARIEAHGNSSRCEIFDRLPATDALGRRVYGDLDGLASIRRLWSFGKPELRRLRTGALSLAHKSTYGPWDFSVTARS